MSFNIHLSRLAVGTVNKWFESKLDGSFIVNWPRPTTPHKMSPYNFNDTTVSAEISTWYPTSSFVVSSYIKTSLPTQDLEYLESVAPNTPSGFIHIAQFDDTVIGIGEMTPNCIQTRFLDEDQTHFDAAFLALSGITDPDTFATLIDQYKTWQEIEQTIAIYLPSSVIALSADNEDAIAPIYVLSGVGFNYISEIPCENSDLYFDFFDGRIQANFGNMKNMYDQDWNVSAEVLTGWVDLPHTSSYVSSALLKNPRTYVNLNVNEDCVWAAYTFDRDYCNTTSAMVPSSIGYYVESNIVPTTIPMEISGGYISPTSAHMFQHIERIAGFNRIGYTKLHKSNLFSIVLRNTNLNSGFAETSATKANVQQSIINIITNIVKKIAPGYTEMFRVYFTDK